MGTKKENVYEIKLKQREPIIVSGYDEAVLDHPHAIILLWIEPEQIEMYPYHMIQYIIGKTRDC